LKLFCCDENFLQFKCKAPDYQTLEEVNKAIVIGSSYCYNKKNTTLENVKQAAPSKGKNESII
jgi:hypothetical protein